MRIDVESMSADQGRLQLFRHNVRIAIETMSGENSCLSGSLKGSRTGYGDWVCIVAQWNDGIIGNST